MASTILEKVAALLAKAEGTSNEVEADAYLSKAQQLATLYSLDLAEAQRVAGKKTRSPMLMQKRIHVGEERKHVNKHLVELFLAVGQANDVRFTIAHNSTYVCAFGYEPDIEISEALWISLATQMCTSAAEHVKSGAWKGQTHTVRKNSNQRWGAYYEDIPVTAAVAKATFYQAYIHKVADRLTTARRSAVKTYDAAHTDQDSNGALVLVKKEESVTAYYKKNNNARGSWSGVRSRTAGRKSVSAAAGTKAGERAKLSATKSVGSKSGMLGKSSS